VTEGRREPYAPVDKHIMFSTCKTFAATTIGLADSEGKMKLSDKVVSFFPYSLPDTVIYRMNQVTGQTVLDYLKPGIIRRPESSLPQAFYQCYGFKGRSGNDRV
jgi:hypothetical protein